MRIVSFNLNGIRSAARKGGLEWMNGSGADFVCMQELKAQPADLEGKETFYPAGWHVYLNAAERKGYSGVGIYARKPSDQVLDKLGVEEFDAEGRYLELRYGNLSVVSLYLPSGSSGPERQASKDRFLDFFMPMLREWSANGRDYVICGDWNIAHTERDLKNWRSNQKNSGFLPHEREWMTQLLTAAPEGAGWMDAYRQLYPETEGEAYTWWSNRGQAYANNVGWRIDYQIITPSLASRLDEASVYKEQKFSDHAPLILDYRL